jgi:hypothetical protein
MHSADSLDVMKIEQLAIPSHPSDTCALVFTTASDQLDNRLEPHSQGSASAGRYTPWNLTR